LRLILKVENALESSYVGGVFSWMRWLKITSALYNKKGVGMNLLVLGFGALIFICLVAACNFFATAKMKEQIHTARQARRVLSNEVSELQATLISKREERKIITSKLRLARVESKTQKEAGKDFRSSTPASTTTAANQPW